MNKDNAAIVIGATVMTFLAFGGLDASDSSARAALAHKHTKKKIGQQQIAVAAAALVRSSNRLLSSVAVAARYSHSLYCATIIEAGIANNARSRAP